MSPVLRAPLTPPQRKLIIALAVAVGTLEYDTEAWHMVQDLFNAEVDRALIVDSLDDLMRECVSARADSREGVNIALRHLGLRPIAWAQLDVWTSGSGTPHAEGEGVER